MPLKRILEASVALALLAPAGAIAAAPTTAQVLDHHLAASGKGDVAGTMQDFADDAVVIANATVTKGKPEIEKVFKQILGSPTGGKVDVRKKAVAGEVAYIMWVQKQPNGGELHGSDTYIVRGGKIRVETVATLLVPAAKP